MNYENILDILFKKISRIKNIYDEKVQEDLIDNETGKHMIFGLVIVPFIITEVNKKTDVTIVNGIFDFLEEMSLCEDVKVRELLDFTILEQFVDEGKEQLDELKKYMRENTLICCLEIEKYFIVK